MGVVGSAKYDMRATVIHYLKLNWISDSTEMTEACLSLERLFLATYKRNPKKEFSSAFNCLITSLYVLGAFVPKHQIAIPVNRNLYFGNTRRNPAYTPEIYKCLRWLIKEGYIHKVSGITIKKRAYGDDSYNPFVYEVDPRLYRGGIDSHSIIRNPLLSYLEVRDNFSLLNKKTRKTKREKRSVPIKPEESSQYHHLILETNQLLKAYDVLMQNQKVQVGNIHISAAQTSLTRIFSRGTLTMGGRFYSSLQNLKSEARKYIRLGDEPTVEIDFSSIHPNILYSLKGLQIDGDPYEIMGWKRSIVKVAFNIMLNRDGGENRTSSAQTIAENTPLNRADALALEEKILSKHKAIKEYFNSDSGLALQLKDSQIMSKILGYFVYELKRPIIPIHDSAVVSVRDVESLRLAMEAAYNEVLSNEDLAHNHLKGIKADSLAFTPQLNELIVESLNGTLTNYDDTYWYEVMDNNKALKCPDELYNSDIKSYSELP